MKLIRWVAVDRKTGAVLHGGASPAVIPGGYEEIRVHSELRDYYCGCARLVTLVRMIEDKYESPPTLRSDEDWDDVFKTEGCHCAPVSWHKAHRSHRILEDEL